ncbi:hypothetical protein SEA_BOBBYDAZZLER_16 [Rhodococcus phage BobbyDazzler]|uniref:Uncharacterized protein n=2 Tax=Rerduovirus TaxID=1982375 RepID=A0A1S5VY14_9CAUD|nr:tail completion or Neck1 protein [Rhodococcus phage Takoda]AOT23587.1 hypothetical protein SEA_HARLEQUIN_16 [Rhodococcus phage Harlequin]AQP30878.1 hypothetical protein SEA_ANGRYORCHARD_15 [Rhodococcus phage AngryOrchard]AQP30943.1 hypothetical protein SEA_BOBBYDAZZLER_16 [Rhodococcus phage BobbyDazzler]ASR80795.1 hypothetical protein SEA_YONCESS_16 [Rhodococcus phage Yoncess]AWY04402.1 hypothetical protein PBI_ALPACADOS_15 [Rhodococcus phage Alpacados]AWY04617.1 hypothetical protein PBI_B
MAVRLYGEREVHRKVVRQKGMKAATRAEAEKIGGRAEALLSMHRRTGAAKITTTSGDVDAFVNLVDEAAYAIELGHAVGGKYAGGDTEWVNGLHILSGAAYGG